MSSWRGRKHDSVGSPVLERSLGSFIYVVACRLFPFAPLLGRRDGSKELEIVRMRLLGAAFGGIAYQFVIGGAHGCWRRRDLS